MGGGRLLGSPERVRRWADSLPQAIAKLPLSMSNSSYKALGNWLQNMSALAVSEARGGTIYQIPLPTGLPAWTGDGHTADVLYARPSFGARSRERSAQSISLVVLGCKCGRPRQR